MAKRSPRPISAAQHLVREKRAQSLAKAVGFVGTVEYRHVYSHTGGAQYGRGSTERVDLLTIHAEAFERDADPQDFSLEAIIAHERGHQILARHPRIAKRVAGMSLASEAILASLLGALICNNDIDRLALLEGDCRVARPRPECRKREPPGSGAEGPVEGVVMIGTKKLSTIREEIEQAFASKDKDAIHRLERLIASAKGKGDRAEVMEDLKRFLESPRERRHRRRRVGANASPRPRKPSRSGD
jgi:hypothetical protein